MPTHRVGRLDIDHARLASDLERVERFEFSDAYSSYLCGGPWKSCMLWSVGGDVGDGLVTHYDLGKAASTTAYARQVPYLTEMIERVFDTRYLNFVRLAIVTPGAVIIPHKDLLELVELPSNTRNAYRVHVPLVTDDNCYFTERNIVFHMGFGEVWFLDAAIEHSAASFSDRDRLHLILDFRYVDDPASLVRLDVRGPEEIPRDAIVPRARVTDAERAALLSLAHLIDLGNHRDIFSLVIKTHYRKDGGDDFIWSTLLAIAAQSGDPAVEARIRDMHEYFVIRRTA